MVNGELMVRRAYSSGVRAAQAALSRQRVLAAADACFLQLGYRGTTLAAVASAAGVSAQTVYNTVGGKSTLVKAVYDARVAGDSEPIPIAQRPQIQALRAATDVRSCLAAYAALGRELGERTVPFLARILPEVVGDAELSAFVDTIENERALGARNVAQHVHEHFGLRPELSVEQAADVLWTLTAPEVADRLVNRRAWGWERFERWLSDAMTEAISAPPPP